MLQKFNKMNDFINDTNDDMLIANGDFVVDVSDEQGQGHILRALPGSFKNVPDGTVGLERFLLDDDIDGMLNDIREKFKADGCPVQKISYDEETGDLAYYAKYTS